MKVTSILFTTILSMATVNANAISNNSSELVQRGRGFGHRFCRNPAEPCTKLKRIAEAAEAAEIVDELERRSRGFGHRFCHNPGEPCMKMKRAEEAAADALAAADELTDGPGSCYVADGECAKTKRDALALVEAVAEAAEAADASNQSCYLPGKPCSVAKREALASVEASAAVAAGVDLIARARKSRFCAHAGEPCLKVRQAAETIAQAIAEPDAGLLAGEEPSCYEPEGICTVHRRALDSLSDVVNDML